MTNTPHFEGSLAFGEAFEFEVRDFVNRASQGQPSGTHWFYKVEGYEKRWDLFCTHCDHGIECKTETDKRYNICFEAPLLNTSEAKWLFFGWHVPEVIEFLPWVFVVEMAELRTWINEQRIILQAGGESIMQIKQGGEQRHNLYLVPRREVRQIPTGRMVNIKTFKTLALR